MFRFVAILAVAAIGSAHYVPSSYSFVAHHPITVKHAEPAAQWVEKKDWDHKEWEKHEEPKNYEFKYEVHDEHTGDIKRQHEVGTHGNVKGQYSLIDSDGFRRLVEYTADAHKGFEAKVTREKTHFKVPVPAPKHHDSWEWSPKPEEPKPAAWEHKAWEAKSWEHKEDETPKNYDFKYEVHDSHTGDIKRQSETVEHGKVKGQYSLIDADGYRRVVEYTADDHNGFQATVKREPTHFKVPAPAKIEEPKPIAHWW